MPPPSSALIRVGARVGPCDSTTVIRFVIRGAVTEAFRQKVQPVAFRAAAFEPSAESMLRLVAWALLFGVAMLTCALKPEQKV